MGKTIRIDERVLRAGIVIVICVLILAGALLGGAYLISRPPQAGKKETERSTLTVRVEQVQREPVEIILNSQGEAQPQRRTTLTAEVGGKLVSVASRFEAGETFDEGELLLSIDRADYEAALASARATLANAKLALETEEARKGQALRDWAKLGNGQEPSDLVKRVPQLASAEAQVRAAEAAVDKALRDLERTEIRVPYDARIERTYVDEGAVVAPGMPLVDLVSQGPLEVRLPLSLEDYGYLQRDDEGNVIGEVNASGAIGGREHTWNGRLIRSEEIVDQKTRSINVVARIEGDQRPALPVGMFVKASIEGVTVPGVVRVPREAMLNRSQLLVVREEEGAQVLSFRNVEVMRTEPRAVLVTGGLEDGERIVLTPVLAPVEGARVDVIGGAPEDAKGAAEQAPVPPSGADNPGPVS